MQELRFVAVSEDGSYAVLAVPGRSARFTLPIDERLRAVALGQTSRLAQYEIEVESPLRPKEIQARIRAGETAEEIADAAGLPVERVRWFEGPVLAERAYVATQAQAASVRRPGDSHGPGPRLSDIVPDRISALGADPQDAEWDSRKRGDGNWQVSVAFTTGGRLHIAEWMFDPRRRHVVPADEAAERLCLPESELPPLAARVPAEATVTPIASRLGAVAGAMGGGGFGTSGYGSGGQAPGGQAAGQGSRYAAERHSPERYAPERHSPERHSPERPAPERHAGHERPAAFAPQPPAAYSPTPPTPSVPLPPPFEPAAYARPPQPPAHTLSPGHGLVPMWDPPDWDPDAEPVAPRGVPTARSERSRPAPPTEPVVPESYRAPAVPPEPEAMQEAPASAEHSDPSPRTGFAFEEPEPVLSSPGPSARPPAPAPETAGTSAAPEAARPKPAPESRPAAKSKSAREAHPDTAIASAASVADTPVAAAGQPAARHARPVSRPAQPAPKAAKPTARAAESTVKAARPAPAAEQVAAAAAPPTAEEQVPAEEPKAAEPTAAESKAAEAKAQELKAEESSAAEEEQARPRPAKGPKAKARRSSVPSWDEIMLGSSRQRD